MKDSKGHTTQSPLLTNNLADSGVSSTSASLLRNQRGAGGAGQVLAQAGGAGGLLARRAAKRQHQVDRARERNQLISETSLIN